jgi:hypothetical protein
VTGKERECVLCVHHIRLQVLVIHTHTCVSTGAKWRALTYLDQPVVALNWLRYAGAVFVERELIRKDRTFLEHIVWNRC